MAHAAHAPRPIGNDDDDAGMPLRWAPPDDTWDDLEVYLTPPPPGAAVPVDLRTPPQLWRHGRKLELAKQVENCLRAPIWNPQHSRLLAPADCPIRNFYWLSPTVMRGGRPIGGFAVLKALGVRTVINLEDHWSSRRAQRERERRTGARYGIEVLNTPLSPIFRLDKQRVDSVLKLMAQPARRPVFIHCRFGQERTGLLVALDLIYNAGWCPRRAYRYLIDYGFRPWLVPALHHQFFTWSEGFCPLDNFSHSDALAGRY